MNSNSVEEKNLDEKITENIAEAEREKEIKLLNLIVEIIVKTTLREFYETCD